MLSHHFWIISVRRVSLFSWKHLSVKEKELFCWREVSKFLRAALFSNARKVEVSEFQVKNYAILRLNILIFLPNKTDKRLLAGTIDIAFFFFFLPKSYLWTKQKMKEMYFSTPNAWYFLTVALKCSFSMTRNLWRSMKS